MRLSPKSLCVKYIIATVIGFCRLHHYGQREGCALCLRDGRGAVGHLQRNRRGTRRGGSADKIACSALEGQSCRRIRVGARVWSGAAGDIEVVAEGVWHVHHALRHLLHSDYYCGDRVHGEGVLHRAAGEAGGIVFDSKGEWNRTRRGGGSSDRYGAAPAGIEGCVLPSGVRAESYRAEMIGGNPARGPVD